MLTKRSVTINIKRRKEIHNLLIRPHSLVELGFSNNLLSVAGFSLSQKNPLEKEMATDFSLLAWRIPWTEEPGGLQSMELQKAGQN